MNKITPTSTDGLLPKRFKKIIGIILLVISIGLMSLWGLAA